MDQLSAGQGSGIEDTDKKNILNKTEDEKDNLKSNRTNEGDPIDLIGEAMKMEEGGDGAVLDINLDKSMVKLSSNKK